MFSSERWERAKMRLVRPLPSRIRPSSRCSVSIEMLPSWLASYRAKKRTRRARSVYRSNIRGTYVKTDGVGVSATMPTLYGIYWGCPTRSDAAARPAVPRSADLSGEFAALEPQRTVARRGQTRVVGGDHRRQAVGQVHLAQQGVQRVGGLLV